ncbi:hypothetical protein [Streptomyces sp. NPDC001750]|uniref:hypothetical protein n=1 Tax=Streptomyces sp. NPDC001750 TaxID=3364607 RepID=UPI0036D0EE76
MTWNSRLDVAEALESAGWAADERNPLGLLRHPSGAVWAVTNDAGDCGLGCPGGGVADFPGDVADAVVIAACLAASRQLDPSQDRVELEKRSNWLGWMEAAGVDNWSGIDTARQMRAEQNN